MSYEAQRGITPRLTSDMWGPLPIKHCCLFCWLPAFFSVLKPHKYKSCRLVGCSPNLVCEWDSKSRVQPREHTCVCVYVCVLVIQSFLTLWNPMDCSPTVSSVHGILQARLLEWDASSFSRGSSRPRIEPGSPTLQADCLPYEPPGKPM